VKLSAVINELVQERGIDRKVLSSIVCEGMLAAYEKKFPDLALRIDYDESADEAHVEIEKEVVNTVEEPDVQISLRKARSVKAKAEVGDKLWLPFEERIGRIEIIRAKQVIASRIRAIEAAAVHDAFKDKEGSIIQGVIHKTERGGVVVKVQDNLAFLPRSLTIPTDKCIVGYPIRALLKEVLPEPRNDNQLILDRTSELFLRRLFELEIPEVFEKLVEIKAIVRTPGYKSKIAVISNDLNIDPVGTCVGVGGIRIKPILKELSGEKIDVIAWSNDVEALVKSALKPAQINKVEQTDDQNVNVWLDDDQRSLAIGKMGQNIALASKLTGVNIHLMESRKVSPEEVIEVDQEEIIENAEE